jgi:hypothetical protein
MNRLRVRLAVIALLMVALTSTGCQSIKGIFGHGDDQKQKAAIAEFVAENNAYHDDRVAYVELRSTMRAARTARRCDEDCWLEYRLNQNAVAAAAPIVKADLDAWGAGGKKPELYEAHKKTLRDALAEIVTIAKEFQ